MTTPSSERYALFKGDERLSTKDAKAALRKLWDEREATFPKRFRDAINASGTHVVVPVEPTEAMKAAGVMALIDAGLDGPDGVGHSEAEACFRAMLKASFQYEQDAEAFIHAQLENDNTHGRSSAAYLMVATGSAEVRSFAPPTPVTGKGE